MEGRGKAAAVFMWCFFFILNLHCFFEGDKCLFFWLFLLIFWLFWFWSSTFFSWDRTDTIYHKGREWTMAIVMADFKQEDRAILWSIIDQLFLSQNMFKQVQTCSSFFASQSFFDLVRPAGFAVSGKVEQELWKSESWAKMALALIFLCTWLVRLDF